MTSRLLILLLNLIAFASIPSALPQRRGEGSSSFTLEVCCSTQKKVDQPHTVTMTVQNGSNPPVTVSVDIPKGTTAAAAAAAVSGALNGAGIAATAPTPNNAPRYAEGTAWTINLPKGTKTKKVKVQKVVGGTPQSDDGHMKFRDGASGKRISNQQSLVVAPAPGLTAFTLKELNWFGDSKSMEIFFSGLANDGTPFEHSTSVTYGPSDPQPANVFGDIGTYLQGLGMVVNYPSPVEMVVSVSNNTSLLNIYDIDFTMYESTDPAAADSEANWEFSQTW